MSTPTSGRPTPEQAAAWLERWDRQQEHYMPDREERFAALLDVVVDVVSRPDPLVVDLGIGPGSLAHRLLDRLPEARVVGVDADPLLLALGNLARPDDRLRTVLADLRDDGWYDCLGLDRAPDVFVSSTALHWMDVDDLRALLARCAQEVAPGGLLVDADHLYEGESGPRLDALARRMTVRRAQRAGTRGHEDWEEWWSAVERAPELAALVAERAGGFVHVVERRATVRDWVDLLLASGFAEAGTLWQYGDDRVVVGLA
ncbi:hypothetical protein GCM10011519_25500 [Marmoricola endophyticus]|uniref:Methyltransferase domain-containing protein n=1 Tax=Marmoricola endophyticus TaxID=2040280 RepID=A0A917BQA9_9ACTN|nr:class I SAM-dependent methyltransferase [Marmoricola endophyticus]GGF50448.1 hypothetical protein GCM10011519_25500 [Marmoricola endophyticus]